MIVSAVMAFFAQSGLITLDEWACHRRRLLPRWELIGHPVDTFCLILFFTALTILPSASAPARAVVLILGGLSCLITTKDEWVHKDLSTGFENWLHAMLFLIHPVVAGLYFLLWMQSAPGSATLFHISLVMTVLFFIYQCITGWLRWPKT